MYLEPVKTIFTSFDDARKRVGDYQESFEGLAL